MGVVFMRCSDGGDGIDMEAEDGLIVASFVKLRPMTPELVDGRREEDGLPSGTDRRTDMVAIVSNGGNSALVLKANGSIFSSPTSV